ncbi:MAG: hypothetical protein IIC74_06555 [Bacteroidetes bacterium]|nr:hypothetical protein [Bacteroidota bacterium]
MGLEEDVADRADGSLENDIVNEESWFKQKAKFIAKEVYTHGVVSYAGLIIANPIFTVFDHLIMGFSDDLSREGKINATKWTFLGSGYLFNFLKTASVQLRQLIDSPSTPLKKFL